MDIKRFKELTALEAEKAQLKIRMDQIDRRLKDLSDPIIDAMVDAEMESMTINGRTIFLREDIWAKREDTCTKEEAINALREAGLEEYVVTGYNHQSLSSYVREQYKSGDPLPKEFEGKISVNKVLSVRTTKA